MPDNKYNQILNNLHSISTMHYNIKTEGLTYADTISRLSEYFFNMKKFVNMEPKGNCNKCRGRGFHIPSDGSRLNPCTCLRIKKCQKR